MILKILSIIFVVVHEIACEVKYKNNCCLTKNELKGTWIADYLANDDDTCFANGGSWMCTTTTGGNWQTCKAYDESKVNTNLKCKADDACLTLDELTKNGFGCHYEGEPNAPCIEIGGQQNQCYISGGPATRGSYTACTCRDASQTIENPYCDPLKNGAADHTMCQYEDAAQTSCGDVQARGFESQGFKDAIINVHNKLRAKVAKGGEDRGVNGIGQPKAANMRKLVWSDELATVAQRWVDQCAGPHDDNRNTAKFSHVGQNWAGGAWVKGEEEMANEYVTMWYDEVKDITQAAVRSFSSDKAVTGATGVIGHYTQVVWADSYEVGCGYMASVKSTGEKATTVLVCNYGPGGNWIGKPVYTQGEPESACPSGTTKGKGEDDGLCV